jgi:hypothetical protein
MQQQVKSASTISNSKIEEVSFKSEKTIMSGKSNPEDKKNSLIEKRYDNIMEM